MELLLILIYVSNLLRYIQAFQDSHKSVVARNCDAGRDYWQYAAVIDHEL